MIDNLNAALAGRKRPPVSTLDLIDKTESELSDVAAEIAKERVKLESLSHAPKLENRIAEYTKLLEMMDAAAPPERYAIRASLAQDIRQIVRVMVFHRFGDVHFVLNGSEKHYFFRDGDVPQVLNIPDVVGDVPDGFDEIHRVWAI
jgi:hypothetical protein